MGARGEGYVLLQFALFALVAFGPRRLPGLPPWPEAVSLPALLVGGALLVAALALALLGLLHLGANLSPLPHPKHGAALVEHGVYSLVRHPIYGGLILAAAGWACLERSGAMLLYALALLVFFELKARREEARLLLAFPGYAAYRARVRKFIPFIY